jgi:hypothetical protein
MSKRSFNTLLLGSMLLLIAGTSTASVTACATAANGSTFASFGAPSAANGCAEIDKSFTSLAAVSGAITTTDLQLWATGSAPAGNTISPVDVNFDTTGSANSWVSNATQSSSFSFVVDAHTGGSFTGGNYPSPNAGFVWAMNSLTLNPTSAFSNNATGTVTIAMQFCLGQATVSGCSVADSGTITATFTRTTGPTPILTFTCAVGSAGTCASPTGNSVNGFAFTELAALDTITIDQTANGNHTITLNNIETDFGQFAEAGAPEPSTFVLFGTALAGVGLLRRRRIKQS